MTKDDTLRWVRSVLVTTPGRWVSLTESLPIELLSRPPAPKEWSALECLQHIVDTERLFASRVRAFLAGQDFPAYDPDRQGTPPGLQRPPAELVAEFSRLRAESLALLDQLTRADLGRQVRHQELGPVTLSEMLHEWAGHDLMHTVQAERAMMQPFIRDCGPWRPYFADHDLRTD